MTLDPAIINSFVTLLVGTIAFIVYKLQKQHEKKSAASIIVIDIRHAEKIVLSILERGFVDVETKDVLIENNWSKYKHLFAQDFSEDDFSSFNNFFDSCIEMSDARKRIRDTFYINVNAKAEILQQKIFNIENLNTEDGQKKKVEIINTLNNESSLFEPTEPKNRMFKNLQLMGNLTKSHAFVKLKKKAGMKV